MFQDFLNYRSNTDPYDKTLEDELLYGNFNKPISTDTLPSMFQDCSESLSEDLHKETGK